MVNNMGDIVCAICGEPWDSYGIRHGDMTPEEAQKFLQGKGCPCCPQDKVDSHPAEYEEQFLHTLVANME